MEKQDTNNWVFDICGTLYRSNTTLDFIRFLHPRFSILLFCFPMRAVDRLLRIFGVDLIRHLAVRSLRGVTRARLQEKAEDFVQNILSRKIIDESMELIKAHPEAMLASATIEPIAKAVCRSVGCSSYVATELEYREEICTGRMVRDLLGKKSEIVRGNIGAVVTDDVSDWDLVEHSEVAYFVSSEQDVAWWRERKRSGDRIIIK